MTLPADLTGAADAAGAPDAGERRREVLEHLDRQLWLFGTANDADDHHCGSEGAELRLAAGTDRDPRGGRTP